MCLCVCLCLSLSDAGKWVLTPDGEPTSDPSVLFDADRPGGISLSLSLLGCVSLSLSLTQCCLVYTGVAMGIGGQDQRPRAEQRGGDGIRKGA